MTAKYHIFVALIISLTLVACIAPEAKTTAASATKTRPAAEKVETVQTATGVALPARFTTTGSAVQKPVSTATATALPLQPSPPTATPTALPTKPSPPTAAATPTRAPEIQATSTAIEPLVSPTAAPIAASPGPQKPVWQSARVYTGSLSIPTYAYRQALITLPNFPYPGLDKELVGPPTPQTYQTVILENDALQLIFLPELGGRLYQIRNKETGEEILYNNPVIKPTRWGPPEMGWWLIVGGMEWAFPTLEHGYAWGSVWKVETNIAPDGSATLKTSFLDTVTNLKAQVTVSLPAKGRKLTISPQLTNTGDSPAFGQLWINTALPAGPGMNAELPAQSVEIHSIGPQEETELAAGQVMPWTPDMGQWGRWKWWFSVFTRSFSGNLHTLRGDGIRSGLQRSFNPQTAPGLKLFTWGTNPHPEEFAGSPYYEVWSGLTPDFNTDLRLAPGASQGWTEEWTVVE